MKYANYNDRKKETYTLSDFIKLKSQDEITYRNLSILLNSNGIEALDHNLITDYLYEIEPYIQYMQYEDNIQRNKYKYAPDILAYDVYGSTQLDFVILILNDMIDYKEFDLSIVRMLSAKNLLDIFNRIYKSNYEYINITRTDNNIENVLK